MKFPIQSSTKCQYEGCENFAQYIAEGRYDRLNDRPGHNLGYYCDSHATTVADEGKPEYIADCPNCGCRFGVN